MLSMQWDEFLKQQADTHELTWEQKAAFLIRLQAQNSSESEQEIAKRLNIEVAVFKKRMTEVYKKFAVNCPDLKDPKCRRKFEKLKAYLTAKYNGIPHTQPTKEIHHNLPFCDVVKFVGRETELQKLHQLLQENQQVAIAAIAGMGGVGKTELALQYAYSQRIAYRGGICWLSALQDVGVQLVQFARNKMQLNPPDDLDLVGKVHFCLEKWNQGDVLLVIDNVTNYREEVRCYLESFPSRFKQLITTREKLQLPIERLDLDVLTPLEAMQLLESIIGEKRLQREKLVAEKLCQWLGYLPLGLELVGRFLSIDEELSLAEMLQYLEKKRLKHKALEEVPQEKAVKFGVADAFDLSWQRLRENTQSLGCLLSLFAQAPIPWDLVERITINNKAQDWKEARRELLQLHLLQYKGEGLYQLHPLLREFFQYKLIDLEQAEEFKRSVCAVTVKVSQKFPNIPTLEQIKDVAPAIPHLAEVANHLIEYVSDDDLLAVFFDNARFYDSQGLYTEAEPWYKRCLEITKQRLGEEHPNVATSLTSLATLYKDQGVYHEAELSYKKALELQRKLLGEEHPNVANSLNGLAELYREQKLYDKAEPLYQKALEILHKMPGEEHLKVANVLNNLALLYRFQGKYQEAEPLFLKVLELDQRFLEEEHLNVAKTLNNLGLLYRSQGKYSEAEARYKQALKLNEKLLGAEHPLLTDSLTNLAALYFFQNRYSEAEPLCLRALELDQRFRGERHPYFTQSLKNLAALYRDQGRYSEAEPLFIEALAMRRKLLGEEHSDVAQSLNFLAGLYCDQGKYSEAEPLFIEALAMRRKLLGEEHSDVAQSLN
ncbi:tetratricopeptide repeat protein, partial [Nostoc parmelioides]